MADVLIEQNTMNDIANAIREKTSTSDTMTASEMPEKIRSIETSSGAITGYEYWLNHSMDSSAYTLKIHDMKDINPYAFSNWTRRLFIYNGPTTADEKDTGSYADGDILKSIYIDNNIQHITNNCWLQLINSNGTIYINRNASEVSVDTGFKHKIYYADEVRPTTDSTFPDLLYNSSDNTIYGWIGDNNCAGKTFIIGDTATYKDMSGTTRTNRIDKIDSRAFAARDDLKANVIIRSNYISDLESIDMKHVNLTEIHCPNVTSSLNNIISTNTTVVNAPNAYFTEDAHTGNIIDCSIGASGKTRIPINAINCNYTMGDHVFNSEANWSGELDTRHVETLTFNNISSTFNQYFITNSPTLKHLIIYKNCTGKPCVDNSAIRNCPSLTDIDIYAPDSFNTDTVSHYPPYKWLPNLWLSGGSFEKWDHNINVTIHTNRADVLANGAWGKNNCFGFQAVDDNFNITFKAIDDTE